MPLASGSFDVKLVLQPATDPAANPLLARRLLDKTFHGDLEATSHGEMLSVGTATPGSAVYVAVEIVVGTLSGKTGSFALHHTGIMNRGAPNLSVRVVPDSGTDQLVGIDGTLDIIIESGKHSYRFDYTLPA